MDMFNKFTIATVFVAAFLLAGTASETIAQGKGGSKGGGGGFGGDPTATRGVGDPRAGTGSDRVYDPTGARSKDPFLATSERVYDPTGSRIRIRRLY